MFNFSNLIFVEVLRYVAIEGVPEPLLKLVERMNDEICELEVEVAKAKRQIEIAEISSGIKALAKELRIPIIVLAQLNRKPDERGGTPRMSDLRESGSIEQDADVIGLLIRAEVYEKDDEGKEEKAGEGELIIAKQRNGPTGEVPLTFLKEFTRFEDRAVTHDAA